MLLSNLNGLTILMPYTKYIKIAKTQDRIIGKWNAKPLEKTVAIFLSYKKGH